MSEIAEEIEQLLTASTDLPIDSSRRAEARSLLRGAQRRLRSVRDDVERARRTLNMDEPREPKIRGFELASVAGRRVS